MALLKRADLSFDDSSERLCVLMWFNLDRIDIRMMACIKFDLKTFLTPEQITIFKLALCFFSWSQFFMALHQQFDQQRIRQKWNRKYF